MRIYRITVINDRGEATRTRLFHQRRSAITAYGSLKRGLPDGWQVRRDTADVAEWQPYDRRQESRMSALERMWRQVVQENPRLAAQLASTLPDTDR